MLFVFHPTALAAAPHNVMQPNDSRDMDLESITRLSQLRHAAEPMESRESRG